MEAMGEWSASLGGMYSCTAEEADFMNQLLASYEHHGGSAATPGGGFWNRAVAGPHHQQLNLMEGAPVASPFYSMDAAGFCFSQESSSYSAGNSGYYAITTTTTTATTTATADNNNNNNNDESSMDFAIEDVTINTSSYLVSEEASDCNAEEYSGLKNSNNTHLQLETVVESHDENLQLATDRHHQAAVAAHDSDRQSPDEGKSNGPCQGSRKRSRATSADGNQRNKRNTKTKRNQIKNSSELNNGCGEGEEEDIEKEKSKKAAVLNRQNSSATCCSEDDSNASTHDTNAGGEASSSKGGSALNLSGKTRASRGAATDPQSLYARKRRERINERLRILQNLVPNGTKVDISTMLEEAVHYVKFLQLQIKLLSSDDLWMYAPIAYNGMDIGLDLKLKMQR